MYYAAEQFHYSGVLAVVSGGLFLSSMRLSMLNYKSRMQGVNVWDSIVFVLNGLVFLLIGLQLPSIIQQLGDVSLPTAIWHGLAISVVLIVTRLLCTFGASIFTKFISRFIPLLVSNDHAFPYRNLILFITFIVILVTLIVQGLTLPWLIRKLNVEDKHATISENDQEELIQKQITQFSLKYLEEKFKQEGFQNKHLKNMQSRLKIEMDFFNREIEET